MPSTSPSTSRSVQGNDADVGKVEAAAAPTQILLPGGSPTDDSLAALMLLSLSDPIGPVRPWMRAGPKKGRSHFRPAPTDPKTQPRQTGPVRIGKMLVDNDPTQDDEPFQEIFMDTRNSSHRLARNASILINNLPAFKLGCKVQITPKIVARLLAPCGVMPFVDALDLPMPDNFIITDRTCHHYMIRLCAALGLFEYMRGERARVRVIEVHRYLSRICSFLRLPVDWHSFRRTNKKADALLTGLEPHPGPHDPSKARPSSASSGSSAPPRGSKQHLALLSAKQKMKIAQPARTTRKTQKIAASIVRSSLESAGAQDAKAEQEAEVFSPAPPRSLENPFVPSGIVRYRHGDVDGCEAQLERHAFQFPISGAIDITFVFSEFVSNPDLMISQFGKYKMRDGRLPSQLSIPIPPHYYDDMVIEYRVTPVSPMDFRPHESSASKKIRLPYQFMLAMSRSLVGATSQDFPTVLRRTESMMSRYYPDPSEYSLDHGSERMRWLIAAALLYLSLESVTEDRGWANFLRTTVFSAAYSPVQRHVFKYSDPTGRVAPGYYVSSTDTDFSDLLSLTLKAGSGLKFEAGRAMATGQELLNRLNFSRMRVNSVLPVVPDCLGASVAPTTPVGIQAAAAKRLCKQMPTVDPKLSPLLHQVSTILTTPCSTVESLSRTDIVHAVKDAGAFDAFSQSDLSEAIRAGDQFIAGDTVEFFSLIDQNASIIKDEQLSNDSQKPVRFVISPKAFVRAYSAFLLFPTTRSLVENTPLSSMMTKHLTPAEVQQKVLARLQGFLSQSLTQTTDISSMEIHVRGIYLDLEAEVYVRNSPPEFQNDVATYFAHRKSTICTAHGKGYQVSFGPSRISGTQETSVGNCHCNALWQIVAELLSERLLDSPEFYAPTSEQSVFSTRAFQFGLVEGDDGLIPTVQHQAQYLAVVKDHLGIDFKLEDEGKFCGTTYSSSAAGVLSVVDPRVVYAKLSSVWQGAQTTRRDAELAVSKAMSYLVQYSHIPSIRKICTCILSQHSAVQREVLSKIRGAHAVEYLASLGFDKFHNRFLFNFTKPPPDSPSDDDLAVEALISSTFGVSPSYQQQFSKQVCGAIVAMKRGAEQIVLRSDALTKTATKVVLEHVPDVRQLAVRARTRHACAFLQAQAIKLWAMLSLVPVLICAAGSALILSALVHPFATALCVLSTFTVAALLVSSILLAVGCATRRVIGAYLLIFLLGPILILAMYLLNLYRCGQLILRSLRRRAQSASGAAISIPRPEELVPPPLHHIASRIYAPARALVRLIRSQRRHLHTMLSWMPSCFNGD